MTKFGRLLVPGLAVSFVGALTLLSTGSAVTACSSDEVASTPDAGGDAKATEKVKIGVSIGLSGDLESFGRALSNAMNLAVEEVNEGGGVLGKPLELVVEDDGTDKADKLSATIDRLLGIPVGVIIGPLGSGQVFASHAKIKAAKVVQISPSATAYELNGEGDGKPLFEGEDRYFFRTVPPDDFQAKAVAKFAFAGPASIGDGPDAGSPDGGAATGCRNMAVVHIDDSYGKGLMPLVKAAFEQRGGGATLPATSVFQIPTKKEDFTNASTVVNSVVAANPDCLVLISYETTAGIFLRELATKANQLKPGFFVIGTDGSYTSGLLENARDVPTDKTSKNYAKGMYGTNPDTNPSGRSQFQAYEAKYKNRYAGQAPPPFSANVYDAVVLAALAIQTAGTSTDGTKIRDALRAVSTKPGTTFGPGDLSSALSAARRGEEMDYQGASGDVDFQPNGSVPGGFIIWRVDQPTGQEPVFNTVTRYRGDELGL